MDEIDHRLSQFFHLLGNGTRLEMVKQMVDREFYVRELAEAIECSEKVVSRHFRVFRDQDKVESESREGKRYYWLKQPDLFKEALALRKFFHRDE